jgi:hypothetical protein
VASAVPSVAFLVGVGPGAPDISSVVDAIGTRARVVTTSNTTDVHLVVLPGAGWQASAADVYRSLTLIYPSPSDATVGGAGAVPTLVIGRPVAPPIPGARRIDDDPSRPPLWERPIEFAAIITEFVTSVERAAAGR